MTILTFILALRNSKKITLKEIYNNKLTGVTGNLQQSIYWLKVNDVKIKERS